MALKNRGLKMKLDNNNFRCHDHEDLLNRIKVSAFSFPVFLFSAELCFQYISLRVPVFLTFHDKGANLYHVNGFTCKI